MRTQDTRFSSVGLWLIAGAVAALGRPGIDAAPLFLFALGWLFHGVITAERRRQALLRSLAFGVGLFSVLGIGGVKWGWPVPAGIFATGVVLYLLPLTALVRWAGRRAGGAWGASLVASVGALGTALADHFDLPFYGLSTSIVTWLPWLLGGARLTGPFLIEGVLLGSVFAAAAAVARSSELSAGRRLAVGAAASGAGALLLVLAALYSRVQAAAESGRLSVGVAQVNADHTYYQSRVTAPQVVEVFERQMDEVLEQLGSVRLVVFSETFDGRYGLLLPELEGRWARRARERDQALVVTSYLPEEDGAKSNAAGLISRRGVLSGVHRKVVLAPYGERTLSAGASYRPLWLEDGTGLGVMICQESMSGRAARSLAAGGAQILVATTNDLSFGSSLLGFEHLAATRLRAIEAGRAIVWASNGGPSGLVDRWGNAHLGPFRRPAAVRADARLYSGVTPGQRLRGPWLALALLAAAASALRVQRMPSPAAAARTSREGPGDGRGKLRALGAGAAGLAVATGVAVCSPALVEWRHGEAERALLAIADLHESKAPYRALDPLERFRAANSVQSAVAYFLTYYGADVTALSVPATGGEGLDAARSALGQGYGIATTPFELNRNLPRIAALVELVDGGVGVVAQPGEQAWLFRPRTGKLIHGTPDEVRSLLGPVGLLPAFSAGGEPRLGLRR